MSRRIERLIVAGIAAIGLAVAPSLAAPQATQPSEKAEKKAAGSHSMTGCLQKGERANMYKLSNVEGKGPKNVEIVETASGVDLAPHVGHKITITGTAVTPSEAAKAEGTKDVKKEAGEHHMRVEAVKMVATTCP